MGLAGSAGLVASPLLSNGQALSAEGINSQPHAGGDSFSPPWTKDLIIYEIGSTQGFTSPRGPGTGTFGSMRSRLPYLQDLGITGIWMDPPSLQDSTNFFYNMWCRYALIAPEKFDPVLGTEQEYIDLIQDAHQRGIRIFPDVKTHGVMNSSPLVKEHPEWFRGVHWKMADYDWYGGHTDLDDWWVKIWSDFVVKYKVDGFRLDVDIFRPDLWKRIRENAAAAGNPIVIFEENNLSIPGVTDFSQHENAIYDYDSTVENPILTQDMPGFVERKFGAVGHYEVSISYKDGTRANGSTDGQGELRVRLDGLTEDKAPRRKDLRSWYMLDGIPDIRLTVENAPKGKIENIAVKDDMFGPWQLAPTNDDSHLLAMEGEPPALQLYLATIAHGWTAIQLSCHDQGWDGFPLDKNPYTAQGSRALIGYSCLLAAAIPIFVSGEEFNATFRPLPWQSPYLYGGKDPGKGRWLYGCMLNWDELQHPEQRAMLEDVKKMIAIRKRETDILNMQPESIRPKLMVVAVKSKVKVPRPYIRWSEHGAILVAANRDTKQDAQLVLQVPLQEIGLAGHAKYKVTDLWSELGTTIHPEADLQAFQCTVRCDKTKGGGLRVLKIEPIG
jgi:hypothetical protein